MKTPIRTLALCAALPVLASLPFLIRSIERARPSRATVTIGAAEVHGG